MKIIFGGFEWQEGLELAAMAGDIARPYGQSYEQIEVGFTGFTFNNVSLKLAPNNCGKTVSISSGILHSAGNTLNDNIRIGIQVARQVKADLHVIFAEETCRVYKYEIDYAFQNQEAVALEKLVGDIKDGRYSRFPNLNP